MCWTQKDVEVYFLLFLIHFFLQPGTRDGTIQCFIKRDKSNLTYHLYLCLSPGKLFFHGYICLFLFHCTSYGLNTFTQSCSLGSNHWETWGSFSVSMGMWLISYDVAIMHVNGLFPPYAQKFLNFWIKRAALFRHHISSCILTFAFILNESHEPFTQAAVS